MGYEKLKITHFENMRIPNRRTCFATFCSENVIYLQSVRHVSKKMKTCKNR
jgi:hypothetical protein